MRSSRRGVDTEPRWARPALLALLTGPGREHRKYTWAPAVIGSNNAAGYQLGTGRAVMAVGGFNGTDPAPRLAQFQALAESGKIHNFIGGTIGSGRGSATSRSQDADLIAAWVAISHTTTAVGAVTVYDLSPTIAG